MTMISTVKNLTKSRNRLSDESSSYFNKQCQNKGGLMTNDTNNKKEKEITKLYQADTNLEVRGEVVMSKKVFTKLNKKYKKEGKSELMIKDQLYSIIGKGSGE